MVRSRVYAIYIKRILDIVLSFAALVILSSVMIITAAAAAVLLGRPVLFTQPRPGRYEKIFRLYKFRSMTNEKGADGKLLPDAKRLTKFGRFLRASSIDELPELFNILKGDMSIVGPRPLSIYYLPHFPAQHRRRHDVRPGLTGLAQVSGRNSLPWDERFDKDIEYVDNLSFALDIKIILQTVMKVAGHSDVSVRGTAQVKDYGPYSILKEEGSMTQKSDQMTYSEIGSYFWMEEGNGTLPETEPDFLPQMDDGSFTFSGRSAIDLVIRDILSTGKKINTVLVPSYGCVSMIQSFVDRGMNVVFYPVERQNGRFVYSLPEADAGSVVLIMSYFGLDTVYVKEAISRLRAQGATVIEDITHNLLSEDTVSSDSDYVITSLRKWFAIPAGGWAGKRTGKFTQKPDTDSDRTVEAKVAAMKEKYDYLTGKITSKEHFLLENARFDNDLIHVDRMLAIDNISLGILKHTDVKSVIKKRRDNANALVRGLKDMAGRVMEIPDIGAEVTPLFVPVFMDTDMRDSLRKYLTGRGIYCPVHWPEVMGAPVGIRARELSLICDQRYGEGDMKAITDAVHEWYETWETRNK